jgi:hypothetical protein
MTRYFDPRNWTAIGYMNAMLTIIAAVLVIGLVR